MPELLGMLSGASYIKGITRQKNAINQRAKHAFKQCLTGGIKNFYMAIRTGE